MVFHHLTHEKLSIDNFNPDTQFCLPFWMLYNIIIILALPDDEKKDRVEDGLQAIW